MSDWDNTFNKSINKFIVTVRERGYGCDKVNSQQLVNGKSVLIAISEGSEYKEYYEIFYSGKDIVGKFIK